MPCANPTVSWTNNVYQMAPVIQVSCGTPPTPASPAYANSTQSNPSHNSTSVGCGNASDNLVAEYQPNGASITPPCTQFTSASSYSNSSPNFSFYQMNQDDQPSNYNDNPDYAILTSVLLNGLQNVQQAYGQTLSIKSGYRSPKVNGLVEAANNESHHPNSPHIYGYAADIASNATTWPSIHKAALSVKGSCVEPYSFEKNYKHVHADWRPANWSPGSCLPSWQ